MKRFYILVMISFILATIPVFSADSGTNSVDFNAIATPIKNKIVVNELAQFNFTIQNFLGTVGEFTIRKAGYPYWDMYSPNFESPISLNVPANGSSSILILVNPLYITSVDTYTLDVGVVDERTKTEQKVPITIGIKSIEPLINGYLPNVIATVNVMPEKIDPRHEAMIKITISNQNSINYTNLTIKIKSRLFRIELGMPLAPNDDANLEFPLDFDSLMVPQKDSVEFSAYLGSRVIVSPVSQDFEIIGYSTREALPEERSFLKIRRGFKFMSNDPSYAGVLKVQTNSFKNLFTTTNPPAEIKKEGKTEYFFWNFGLDSDMTKSVYLTQDYRPLLAIFFIIILSAITYFIFRSPIVVRKGVVNIVMSNGGISELKGVVRVRNRGSRQLSGIEVMDTIPKIGHIEKELSIGSMQPHAVLHNPKTGIIIKWTIDTLEAGDERVLSYKMKSRLPILGSFSLPYATARYKSGKRNIVSNSNRANVGS